MKLIDMEQKIFVPIVDDRIGTSYEVETTIEEFFKKFLEEFNPKVIDAIPVDWLEKHSKQSVIDEWREGSNETCRDI